MAKSKKRKNKSLCVLFAHGIQNISLVIAGVYVALQIEARDYSFNYWFYLMLGLFLFMLFGAIAERLEENDGRNN